VDRNRPTGVATGYDEPAAPKGFVVGVGSDDNHRPIALQRERGVEGFGEMGIVH
jgi:hypothetical protein